MNPTVSHREASIERVLPPLIPPAKIAGAIVSGRPSAGVTRSVFIDTHTHMHDGDFPLDADEVIARARYAGVERMVVIGTEPENSRRACEFASRHEGVFWSFGWHPGEGGDKVELAEVWRAVGDDEKLVSIGEIGLDYHYAGYDRAGQIRRLERMLDLAVREALPVNFHVREAFADFWPVLDNFRISGGVMHSFSDSAVELERALERGLYVGVNGLATFADLALPPLERMVLETDAPFLAPVPLRGRVNESAYVREIAEYVAGRLGVELDEVARVTTANAEKLFGI